jgi:transcriptional regulator GlxA family with amidase domain
VYIRRLAARAHAAIDKNAIFDTVFAMKVSVLALESVFDTGLATVLDAFQTANELAELSGLSSSRFDVTVVGVRKNVKTSQGFTVPVRPVAKRVPDCVVVPAIGFKMPDPLQRALARPDVARRDRGASAVGRSRSDDERGLHWNVRARRVRPAQRA